MSLTLSMGRAALSADFATVKKGYIASPIYDWVFFIASPLIALAIGVAIAGTPFASEDVTLFGNEASISSIFIGTFIMAHLGIVFFRSHLNQEIFKLYPIRFTIVPVALFAAMCWSRWLAVAVSVLATWWDVYHSGLQTFGLGRIYDMKAGNDARVGRRLDFWLNLLLYAGPILAGATLMDHVQEFKQFREVGSIFFTRIPAAVESQRHWLSSIVVAVGVSFLLFYVAAYVRLYRQGYKVSFQKVALLVSTGLCSIYSWGFNSFGEAFFVMNFFHALQYFAIVWWMEKKNLVAVLGMQNSSWGKLVALAVLVMLGFGYGFWAEMTDSTNQAAYNIIMVIAIMHFWYDGFIWSVRKKLV